MFVSDGVNVVEEITLTDGSIELATVNTKASAEVVVPVEDVPIIRYCGNMSNAIKKYHSATY